MKGLRWPVILLVKSIRVTTFVGVAAKECSCGGLGVASEGMCLSYQVREDRIWRDETRRKVTMTLMVVTMRILSGHNQ